MIKLEVDQEFINQISCEVTDQVIKGLSAKYAVASQWPAMLDYKDIMKFFRCSQPKANEIMRIRDFPVVGNVGRKCVPLWKLIDWVDSHDDYNPERYHYSRRM